MHATGAVCLTFLDFSLEEVHTPPNEDDLQNTSKLKDVINPKASAD